MNSSARNSASQARIERLDASGRYEPYARRILLNTYAAGNNVFIMDKHRIVDDIRKLTELGRDNPVIRERIMNLNFIYNEMSRPLNRAIHRDLLRPVMRNITHYNRVSRRVLPSSVAQGPAPSLEPEPAFIPPPAPVAPLPIVRRLNMVSLLRERAAAQGIPSQPVDILRTLDNGDCFYSSIYRAAKERRGMLERIARFLGLNNAEPTEDEFIDTFRQKVADSLLAASAESELYPRLKYVSENDPESYKEMMEQYPRWFVDEFGKYGKKLGTKDNFYERLLHHIVQRGAWVAQIEVEDVQELLRGIGIRLMIWRNKVADLPPRAGDEDILWLYNPGEAHYEYFSFGPEATNANSVNINSNVDVGSLPSFNNVSFDPVNINSNVDVGSLSLLNNGAFSNNETNSKSTRSGHSAKTRKIRLRRRLSYRQ